MLYRTKAKSRLGRITLRNSLAGVLLLTVIIFAGAFTWYYGESRYAAGHSDGLVKGNIDGNSTGYQLGWIDGNKTGFQSGLEYASNPFNIQNGAVQFNSTELSNFNSIKSRLRVINTDPAFPNDARTLEWISMRNSTSAPWDPYQKSMEYLCFWSGQGAKGEWEAVVSIYNRFGTLDQYTVEVSRFTWHSLEVTLDGNVMATFPQVTADTTSLGYVTFQVQP
jgi:hypothetical protein